MFNWETLYKDFRLGNVINMEDNQTDYRDKNIVHQIYLIHIIQIF